MTFSIHPKTIFICVILMLIGVSLFLLSLLLINESHLSTKMVFQTDQGNIDLKERSLEYSPNKTRLAYLQSKDYENFPVMEDPDYISVIVEQNDKREVVFQNNFRISNLEWLNDRDLVIYQSCGTECMIAYIVNTETKKQQRIALGGGYTWSPNKQYAIAHHSAVAYGISVANRENQDGEAVFKLRRKHPPGGSALGNLTNTAWSSDSTKLAVMMRKENEEKLELLVFDVLNNFKPYSQQDLISTDASNIVWEGPDTIIVTDSKGSQKLLI